MRTTVSIDEPVLHNAKQYAAEHGTTLSAVVQDGLVMLMSASKAAAAAGPVKLPVKKGRLIPDVEPGKLAAYVQELEDRERYGNRS